jgi:hypothetical protein
MKRGILGLLVSLVSIVPVLILVPAGLVDAQLQTAPTDSGHIVSCTGVTNGDGGVSCDWCEFVKLIGNMVQYSIYLAVILSSLMFAYAGFLFLTNNGNPANITKARSIFVRALLGTIAILAAWLIVNAIMTKLATNLDIPNGNWNDLTGCSKNNTPKRQEVVVPDQNTQWINTEYASDEFQRQLKLQQQNSPYDDIVKPRSENFF